MKKRLYPSLDQGTIMLGLGREDVRGREFRVSDFEFRISNFEFSTLRGLAKSRSSLVPQVFIEKRVVRRARTTCGWLFSRLARFLGGPNGQEVVRWQFDLWHYGRDSSANVRSARHRHIRPNHHGPGHWPIERLRLCGNEFRHRGTGSHQDRKSTRLNSSH